MANKVFNIDTLGVSLNFDNELDKIVWITHTYGTPLNNQTSPIIMNIYVDDSKKKSIRICHQTGATGNEKGVIINDFYGQHKNDILKYKDNIKLKERSLAKDSVIINDFRDWNKIEESAKPQKPMTLQKFENFSTQFKDQSAPMIINLL